MCVICYAIASVQAMFTTEWFVEMLGFIAVGVICDGLASILDFITIKSVLEENQ